MAELHSKAGNDRHRKNMHRAKRLSTKVDLTPMVDLGFLLITFFIITTTWSEPKSMKLFLPKGEADMPIGNSTALTVIPINNNRVFYYHGELPEALIKGLFDVTNFSITKGIGEIIRKKQLLLDHHPSLNRKDLILIIKPSDESNYKNLVDIMDEVLINNVTHYSVVDLHETEKIAMSNLSIN